MILNELYEKSPESYQDLMVKEKAQNKSMIMPI